jgi:hypothetical protein
MIIGVEIEVPGVVVEVHDSLALTDKKYYGDPDEFRVRLLPDGKLRIHLPKDALRDRPDHPVPYVAIDVDGAVVARAVAMAMTGESQGF